MPQSMKGYRPRLHSILFASRGRGLRPVWLRRPAGGQVGYSENSGFWLHGPLLETIVRPVESFNVASAYSKLRTPLKGEAEIRAPRYWAEWPPTISKRRGNSRTNFPESVPGRKKKPAAGGGTREKLVVAASSARQRGAGHKKGRRPSH